jgi:deoxyribodipyrimidine photo-lyase
MKTFIVWFKRDLRWIDRAPLMYAAAHGRVLLLWVYESEQWQQPTCPRSIWLSLAKASQN